MLLAFFDDFDLFSIKSSFKLKSQLYLSNYITKDDILNTSSKAVILDVSKP